MSQFFPSRRMSRHESDIAPSAPGRNPVLSTESLKELFEMKKPLVTMLLMMATVAIQPLALPSLAAGQAAAPQQKKEIKDPAEYNAYVNAVQQADPKAKATALQSFLQTYPNSVMKTDAMELLMAAYQQAGDQQNMLQTAQQIIQVEPNNVRALALLAYTYRMMALQTGNKDNAAQAAQYGQKGLTALQVIQKPAEVSDADFEKLKKETQIIFDGAAGFGALNTKDYATAQKDFEDGVNLAGANASFLDVYQLALADLEANPVNPKGLWYIAHAAATAPNDQAKKQLGDYGRKKYNKFHGSEQGWPELLTAAAASPTPPQGFTVAPAPPPPSPAEQAADLVKSKEVKDMSFAEWQLVLSSGNQDAADKVWNTIHDKQIQLVAFVISASRTKLELAGSTDDNDAHKADITVTMATPIPAAKVPKEGATVQFQAAPDTYTPNPFMMNMKDGELPGVAAAPAHKPAGAHKKPAAQ
ncbi:hypothetical protein Acid345_2261 [Candidatus Koribacter versatilis Ellin345]|uniref:Tetratricopeptide repeat protein n=2 Tax=Candidatus Korobacter versatilis TaxID=658062 RepID=Q1IPD8_KORVE|nr:hypothetical protein Acid345_2261 [Candidatus Koribacter versatilis Ellin345]